MKVTAKNLILDLLSPAPEGVLPVSGLIAAGGLFGITANSMRVTLVRLSAAGVVEQDERGQYRLSAAATAVNRQVVSWRDTERRVRPWRGGWVGVFLGGIPRSNRHAYRQCEKAMKFFGFRELESGLYVRPDNLVGGVAAIRSELRQLGLPDRPTIFALNDLDAETERRATSLWDVAALRAGYRRSIREMTRSEKRLATLSTEAALVESFQLGGQVIRQIVLDPLLPEPIVEAKERVALVDAMRHYDRVGRKYWGEYLRVESAIRQKKAA